MRIRSLHLCFLITLLVMGIFVFTVSAHGATAGASIDADCKQKKGTFTVPGGNTATDFKVTLNSSWLPCGGTGKPERIGAKIVDANGLVRYYGIKYYNNTRRVLTGNLATLSLGPGLYVVEVPDGGKLTSASVSYTLKPTAPAWGPLTGDWSDPAVKSKARIVQTGNAMTITNTFMWQGKSVQWTGTGTVTGNKVQFNYSYTRNKPALWENGTMYLIRTNKKTLSGKWVAHSKKYQQAITFVRTSSDDEAK